MKYVMLEVGGNGRIRGEYPGLDITEEFEDWQDVTDNCGSEGLIPLGDGLRDERGGELHDDAGEYARPPCLYVHLNRRDPSRGEAYYEIKGIIVPENAVGQIKSMSEWDEESD